MRCFYHEEKQAVGLCKSCGKGICKECAVDLTTALACRGHCEESVRSIIQRISEYDKRSEQFQKQFEEYKAAMEQSKKDKEQWRKSMSEFENRFKLRKPPDAN
jgi:prefoldin subunit 5